LCDRHQGLDAVDDVHAQCLVRLCTCLLSDRMRRRD
jgi:hypothetical protein